MRQPRVLIFDDEEYLLDLYRDIFQMRGYEVLAFTRPRVCLVQRSDCPVCPQSHPCADIIITDFQMPEMNGLDLLDLQTRRGCKLDIRNKALVSGYIDEEKIRRMEVLGCVFFHKPLNMETLLRWVDECENRFDLTKPLAMQRKEQRSPGSPDTPCEVALNDDRIACRTLNVSRSGCCLELPVPLAEKQVVRISSESPALSREALVRWVSRISNGSYRVGLSSA